MKSSEASRVLISRADTWGESAGLKEREGETWALPCVHAYLLAKVDSSARVSERVADILWASAPSPEDPF